MEKGEKTNNLPLILLILDGWGIAKPNKGNAVALAHTPTMDGLVRKYASTKLYAHGRHVGLPRNQVGNSEAGHVNIGAGRLVVQDAVKITKSISDGTFFKNSAFLGAVRHVKKLSSKVHIMGLLSNGQSPHSDPEHLYAIVDLLRQNGIENIHLHLFTDGRDSPKYAALNLIDDLEKRVGIYVKTATIMGRYYAMDRKKSWTNTEIAYNAIVLGEGRAAKTAKTAITQAYNRGESDEYIQPYIIGTAGQAGINDGDSIIFFNLRSDRARQLTKAFVQKDFNALNKGAFKRKKILQHLYYVAMTDFGPDLDDILTAYPSMDLKETLPMRLKELKQLYIAETEKYAHVTYFFNGGYSGTVAGEDHLLIPSPNVKSYDATPPMSSIKLAKTVIDNLKKGRGKRPKYDVTVLNFAAPDMVGHTGNLTAGIACCSAVDRCVRDIVKAYLKKNGTVLITADHGNIEKMVNLATGEVYTEHTTNLVPFIIVNHKFKHKKKLRSGGALCDISPTILKLLDRKKPKEMKGKPLF